MIGERGYLKLIEKVISHGEIRTGRNGITRSLFGEQLRFQLQKDSVPILPLLTTKFVPYRLVLEELRWFIQGKTDNKWLMDRSVKIWDANAKAGPLWNDCPEEDLGPIYGFQWRHFGAKYDGHKTDDKTYENEGADQIAWILKELTENPGSRRAILSAWNPCALPEMTLPPCHVLSQYWIGKNGLSCHLYQRSADIGLGVPFNIASYSLLTHAFAKALGIPANELVMSFGDCHIYEDHIDGLREQVEREPKDFPTINIPDIHKNPIDILSDKDHPITISDYEHCGVIRLAMIA